MKGFLQLRAQTGDAVRPVEAAIEAHSKKNIISNSQSILLLAAVPPPRLRTGSLARTAAVPTQLQPLLLWPLALPLTLPMQLQIQQ